MAFDHPTLILGHMTAAGNYSSATNQFKLVKASAGQVATLTTGVGSPVLGVLYNRPTSGAMAQVAVGGVVKVHITTAAGAVAVGDKIGPSTVAGYGDVSTAVSRRYIGYALTSMASGGGGIISVLWAPGVGSSGAAGAA